VSAKIRLPSLRHHKPSNQAVVTLSGRDVYLGTYGTPEAQRRYEQAVAEWPAGGRVAPAPKVQPHRGSTIAETLVPYVVRIIRYFRREVGSPTGEAENIQNALAQRRALYCIPCGGTGNAHRRGEPAWPPRVRSATINQTYRSESARSPRALLLD
jgi:hypothetical protein